MAKQCFLAAYGQFGVRSVRAGTFHFWSTPRPASRRSRHHGSTSQENETIGSSTLQSSVGESNVILERSNERRIYDRPQEGLIRTRYLKRIQQIDRQELAFRLEVMEALELKNLSHEDMGIQYCVNWLQPPQAHFFS